MTCSYLLRKYNTATCCVCSYLLQKSFRTSYLLAQLPAAATAMVFRCGISTVQSDVGWLRSIHTWRVWFDHPQVSGAFVQSAGQLLARTLSVLLGCGPTLAGVCVQGPAWTRKWTRTSYTEGLAVSSW